jgi:RNA recognition motif-containing protein
MGKRIYVGNLRWKATAEELKGIFGEVGRVLSAEIPRSADSDRSMGFGFVEFETEEEAKAALDFWGYRMQGRPLTVEMAKERVDRRARARNRERAGHERPGMRGFAR